jgi:AraC-like DNA-binding protein
MYVEGLHEKSIFLKDYKFRLLDNTEADFDYPFHWHSAVELLYITEGDYKATVNNREILLDERDILFIAAGDIHGFKTHGNTGRRIFIQFDITMLEGFGNLNMVKPFLSQTLKISRQDGNTYYSVLEEQIHKIINEQKNMDFTYELFINARIYDMLAIVSRIALNDTNEKKRGNTFNKIYALERINNVFKYIEKNYRNNISLEDASKAAGFSTYHFSRLFKEITEKNFHYYLNEFRIRQAERLLADNTAKISDVAYSVGFNSITTFNRVFRELKGFSPVEYKKSYV